MNRKQPDQNVPPEQLAGGYAAGNLSAEEERRLYEAALRDQAVFDALMTEQPLREMLEQPAVRAELVEALAGKPKHWAWVWSGAGVMATAALALVFLMPKQKQLETPQVEVAKRDPVFVIAPETKERREVAPRGAKPSTPPPVQDNVVVSGVVESKREEPVAEKLLAAAPAEPPAALRSFGRASPAPKFESAPLVAPLSLEHTVSAEGVRIIPSEDGYVYLTGTREDGSKSAVRSARVTKGQQTLILFESTRDVSARLVFSRVPLEGTLETDAMRQSFRAADRASSNQITIDLKIPRTP